MGKAVKMTVAEKLVFEGREDLATLVDVDEKAPAVVYWEIENKVFFGTQEDCNAMLETEISTGLRFWGISDEEDRKAFRESFGDGKYKTNPVTNKLLKSPWKVRKYKIADTVEQKTMFIAARDVIEQSSDTNYTPGRLNPAYEEYLWQYGRFNHQGIAKQELREWLREKKNFFKLLGKYDECSNLQELNELLEKLGFDDLRTPACVNSLKYDLNQVSLDTQLEDDVDRALRSIR